MELYGTTSIKVNVSDRAILEAALKLVYTKTGLREDHYLTDDGKVLMEAYDHGNHRGGIERKRVRGATAEDLSNMTTIDVLSRLTRGPA